MSSSQSVEAVDLKPDSPARPNLALALAILAVPGSTIAWELTLGGLWIGLPLSIAAIVLGLRARRDGVGTGRATAAMAIAGLCMTQMAVWTAVSVADGSQAKRGESTIVLKELDDGASFTHIRNTQGSRRSNLQGDLIASVSPVTDQADNHVGRIHLACTTTKGARNFLNSQLTCSAVATLEGGTLTSQFMDGVDETVTGAITGGTGVYTGASGTFTAEATDYGALNTITLTD